MWNYVNMPQEINDPEEREKFIEQFAIEKMREYDGTVFISMSRWDKERRLTFRHAAEKLGCSARDGRAECSAWYAEVLAKRPRRNILFVEHSMQQYLGEYLDACPAGARHLLLYSRRRGNGPSPYMSAFMDFWLERGVDIWDFRDVDESQNKRWENPLINMTGTAHWRDSWWILDAETSGLRSQETEIIALYLAHMENFSVDEERVVLIRPQKPLEPRIERLTGISNQALEQRGIPLEEAMRQLKELEGENFLIHDGSFTLPFLERACAQCGIEYRPRCVLLDRLAALLLRDTDHGPVSLVIKNLLENLPAPPDDWPDVPPNDRSLEERYRLALALFGKLAVEYDVHDTYQLVHLFGTEE